MATAKREIYARLAVQVRTNKRAAIAEKKCPGAMGMYAFLLAQSRAEQTHGETFDAIAFASWGADTPAMLAYRRKQAAALVDAGLVERQGDDLVVVKYLEHNDGPEDIKAAKDRQNIRQDKKRHPERYANDTDHVTRDTPVTSRVTTPVFPISSSYSLSGSSSESRSEDPDSSPRAREVRRFDAGTASAERAVETFEAAASAATGGDFALARAPFHTRDLCLALNKHAPKELTSKPDILRWLESIIAVWVKSCDPPAIEPGKLLTWLNNGRKPAHSRGSGGGPRGDRQGLPPGPIPWLPTGTDDPFGGDS